MITAKLRPKEGFVELQGHAGAAPHGQDLVCAAVTALVCAYAQRISELEQQGALEGTAYICLEPGNAVITARGKEEYAPELLGAYRLLRSGLQLLQKHYPQHLEVAEEM